MSLTSCYKYSIELPETSLTMLLRSVLSQEETVPAQFVYHEEDIPVGSYLLTVDASLTDGENAGMDVSGPSPGVRMSLSASVDVTVQGFIGLDPIVYDVAFVVPGAFGLTAETIPWLAVNVGPVTPAALGLVVSGGELSFAASIFEAPVHDMYAANPSFAQVVETVSSHVVIVETEDTLTNPITVELPASNTLRINVPGTIQIRTSGFPSTVVGDGTLVMSIDMAIVDDHGPIVRTVTIDCPGVVAADVALAITWTLDPGVLGTAVAAFMPGEIATRVADFGPQSQELPGSEEVKTRVGAALAEFLSDTTWKLIPLDQGDSDFPLGTAVPVTDEDTTLILLVESEPTATCDTPEVYVPADQLTATAVGPIEAQARLDAAAVKVTELTGTQIDGYDVTLNQPTFSLRDPGEDSEPEGHIWIVGTAVVHVGGCVGDVDVEYAGAMMLDVSTAPNGDVNFSLRPGHFETENDKDKKEDVDPADIQAFLASLDWDFPKIPTHFEGLGDVRLDFNRCSISRAGIVVSGGVTITTINSLLLGTVLPHSAYWANP